MQLLPSAISVAASSARAAVALTGKKANKNIRFINCEGKAEALSISGALQRTRHKYSSAETLNCACGDKNANSGSNGAS